MGKYDFELEFSGQNSLLLMLEQIKPGSTVLEFGPANGRLTKYLKQVLKCNMYLVELDEEAGREALQYAEDLVVGDAEEYEWLEKYRSIKFDYILFPDILEHLRDPKQLLITSKLLLKEDGSIIMSVPNMAHNAIMINMLNNNLEYDSTGLLDNTHIHFFTKNGLENMVGQAGLYVTKRFVTYKKTEVCEVQAEMKNVAGISEQYWKNRPYGEVYQYVYEVKKNIEFSIDVENYIKQSISKSKVQVFLKNANGYSEDAVINKFLQNYEGQNFYKYVFPEVQTEIRIDPIDTCCVLALRKLETDDLDRELVVLSDNASYKIGEYYFFDSEDPQLYIAEINGEGFSNVNIEFECFGAGNRELINRIQNIVEVKSIAEVAEKELDIELLKESVKEECRVQMHQESMKYKKIEMENEELKTKLREKEIYIESFKKLLVEKERICCETQAALDGVYNSKTWKLNRFLAKLIDRK